jgi:hypothetical protein
MSGHLCCSALVILDLPSTCSATATYMLSPIVCMMQSMATLVLPAPVGAHTSMFSAEYRAAGHTRDCGRKLAI